MNADQTSSQGALKPGNHNLSKTITALIQCAGFTTRLIFIGVHPRSSAV